MILFFLINKYIYIVNANYFYLNKTLFKYKNIYKVFTQKYRNI